MSGIDDMDPAEVFQIEAGELLAQIEATMLDVAGAPEATNKDTINRLFRAFHTIKGSGAMCGFEAVARFTHHVENALNETRDGKLRMSSRLVELILSSVDEIKQLLTQPAGPAGPEDETSVRIVAGLRELTQVAGTNTASPAATAAANPPPKSRPAAPSIAPAPAPAAPLETYQIRFVPSAQLLARGFDPAALFQELHSLGRCGITEPVADTTGAPRGWEITLASDRGLNAIKDAFIFFQNDAEISIAPLAASELQPANAAPPAAASAKAGDRPAPAAERGSRQPEPARAASTAAATPARAGAADSVVRVPSAKLDRLVTLVGEMVMNQSRLSQVATRLSSPDLAAPTEALERLVAELRDSVLGIRMTPIGTTFNRFKRLVHDLSRELGKEIELVTEGGETELDKTVLDQLGEPLVHLIRNSIDHGIEPPDERVRAGKPRLGTIRLSAVHEGAQVVVSIQDDGRGLDVARIRAKAVEKKLIKPDAALSEQDIFDLILLPGFSTAEKVTSVSGRGVGMDVVNKQLDALHGDIGITSRATRGTRIRLTLPLTLAIIDGLLVEVGGDQFIIPMAAVTENVELPAADRGRNNGRNLVAVRGELISYIRLREIFQVRGAEPAIEKIVLVKHAGQRVGLVVDRVLGSHQTVIQSLGKFYEHISVVSGSTIMGDGRVALILELAGLVAFAERRHRGDQRAAVRAA